MKSRTRARRTPSPRKLLPPSLQLESLEPRYVLTDVGGIIASDTVWDLDNSPYDVLSDVTVPAGVTLNIEPGVVVQFAENTGLTVNGRLVAEGSPFHRIVFDRAPDAPDWDGLEFTDTLADSQITYADMLYGDDQGEAINVNHSRLLLDNITWQGTSGTILELEHPSVVVRNSGFPVSDGGEIIHGEFIEGDEYLIIEGNVFANSNNGGDVIDVLGADRPGPVMQILNNVFLGGGDDGLDLDGTDAHVEGNLFMNFHLNTGRDTTSNAIATGLPQNGASNRTQITIVRNIFADSDHAILVKEDAFATVENNVFVDMTEAAIQFDEVDGTAVGGPGLGAVLDGNIFWNNAQLFKNLVTTDDFSTQLNVNRSLLPNETVDFDGLMISAHSLGIDNLEADPLFVDSAGRDYRLQPGSPAIGTGPDGLDMGAYVLAGPTITGVPTLPSSGNDLTFQVGGPGITHYRHRLNDGSYGPMASVSDPIQLTDLVNGDFTVDVIGMNDAGEWFAGQTPAFGHNTAEIIAPTQTRTGETLPMIVRVRDWQGEINTLVSTPAVLEGSGDLDAADVRIKKGVGSSSPVVTAEGSFSLSVSGDLAGASELAVTLLDGTFPVETYSGSLTGDTLWDATAERQITDDLLIPAGSTLTVEAGTRIMLGDQVNIRVEGQILTKGTADQPVVFNAVDRAQPWGGLEIAGSNGALNYTFFTNGGADESRAFGHSDSQPLIMVFGAEVDCNNCFIINNVGKAFGSRNDAIVNIDQSIISDVDTGGQFNGSIVTVTDTWLKNIPNDDGVFNDDDNDGFYLSGVHTSGEPSLFQDSFIIATKDDGLDHNGARLRVERAWIEGVAHEGIAASNSNWVTVEDSVFMHNNQGVEAGYREPNVTVANSVIVDNDNTSDPGSPITAGLRFGDGYDGSNGNYLGHITATNLVTHDNGDNVRNYDGTIPGPQDGAIDITFSLTNDPDYDNDQGNLTGIPHFGPFMHLLRGSAGLGAGDDGENVGRVLSALSRQFTVDSAEPLLLINEVLAENVAAVPVNDAFPDFVELYNGGGADVDLSGMSISRDASNPAQFVFPADTVLAAGDYLTLVADEGSDADLLFLGFSLDQAGDDLFLYDKAAAGGGLVDSITFGRQLADRSLARVTGSHWQLAQPTYGEVNISVSTASSAATRINELLAEGDATFPDDFVELFNPSSLPTDIGGLYLTDDPEGQPDKFAIPPLSFVEAGGWALFFADGETGAGGDHLNFTLAADTGSVRLSAADQTAIDQITYGPQTAGISLARLPSGADLLDFLDPPTPSEDNPWDPSLDSTPPNAPPNLQAVVASDTQVDLFWDEADDPQSGVALYRIYRDNFEVGTTTTTVYSDTDVAIGESHTYEVSAVNNVDLESPRSVPVNVTVAKIMMFQQGVFPWPEYEGTSDTWIRGGGNADNNFGTDPRMDADGSVSGGTTEEWAMISWDLSEVAFGSSVENAVITMTLNNASGDDYGIYAMTQPWVESEANWNQYAAGQAWEQPGTGPSDRGALVGTLVTSDQTGSHDVVLNAVGRELVRSWIDSPTTNYGVIVYNTSATDGMEIRTSNYNAVDQRPKLTLALSEPDVIPPTATSAEALLGQSPQAVEFQFSENVQVEVRDLVITNTVTSETIDPGNMILTYTPTPNMARWDFTGLTGGVLPAGEYTAALQTANITDAAGNPLNGNGLETLAFTRLAGDNNGDQQVDALDIDHLCSSFAAISANGLVDLNSDGTVDQQDADELILNILGTHYGDANLDGNVDGEDFGMWNANRFQEARGWADGDFTCDGVVDGSDFNRWLVNRFTAAPLATQTIARQPQSPLAANANANANAGMVAAHAKSAIVVVPESAVERQNTGRATDASRMSRVAADTRIVNGLNDSGDERQDARVRYQGRDGFFAGLGQAPVARSAFIIAESAVEDLVERPQDTFRPSRFCDAE